MNNITNQSAARLAQAILNHEITSEAVVSAYLARINQVNPTLNAVVQLHAEQALVEACQADTLLKRGAIKGPLHGLPVTIKDNCQVEGFITTEGLLANAAHKAKTDATVVARLRKAGAIILGITNMPTLGVSYETDNLVYGRTNNPYDLSRTCGGSSGGEAAIIAAAGSAFGMGTDGAGSIRVPSHFCGIAGIKPTFGRVPSTGALPNHHAGLIRQVVSFGPMARFVDDLILALPIISGPDGLDPYVAPVPLQHVDTVKLNSLRVAYFTDNGIATPTPDTIKTVQNAVRFLQESGMNTQEALPPCMPRCAQLLAEVFFLSGDGGQGCINYLNHIGENPYSPLLTEFLELAKNHRLTLTEFHAAVAEVDLLRRELNAFFTPYDVIISPVCATPAKLHGESSSLPDFTYSSVYNLTNWPAVSVRCGTSKEGLPIGVQIIAHPWREEIALAVAKKLEEAFLGWQAPKACG